MKNYLLLFTFVYLAILSLKAEKRIALVIGNNNYNSTNIVSLKNPINDATSISSELSKCHFDVKLLTDASLQEMEEAIISFVECSENADVSLVYYSGHGIQIPDGTFIIPVDAKLEKESTVKYQCYNINQLLDLLNEASQTNLKILVLDACRKNTFTNSWYRTLPIGMSPIPAPAGTYIAYSTAEGAVAYDGDANLSPYAKAFIDNLKVPGLDLLNFFQNVEEAVMNITNNEQTPFSTKGGIKGKFFFNTSAKTRLEDSINQPVMTNVGFYTEGLSSAIKGNFLSYNDENERAIEFFKKGTDSLNVYAKYCLADAYCYGKGVKKNKQIANKLYKECRIQAEEIQESDPYALFVLGMLCINGTGGAVRQPELGFEMLETSAERGCTISKFLLGVLILQRMGTEKNPEKAVHYLESAASEGNFQAAYLLGSYYLQGSYGIIKDLEKARYFLAVAKKLGSKKASSLLNKI